MKVFKIILVEKAKQDIRDIVTYYEAQQKGLGRKFALELKKRNRQLQKAPYASSVIHGDKIFPSLKKFPFYIAISVHDESQAIVVWAVLHHKQSPEKWP